MYESASTCDFPCSLCHSLLTSTTFEDEASVGSDSLASPESAHNPGLESSEALFAAAPYFPPSVARPAGVPPESVKTIANALFACPSTAAFRCDDLSPPGASTVDRSDEPVSAPASAVESLEVDAIPFTSRSPSPAAVPIVMSSANDCL